MTPGGDVVPFYFQPTQGGWDINGNPSLPNYQDYRLRALSVMFLRESFEHSVWSRIPLGISLMADRGKVALTRGTWDPIPGYTVRRQLDAARWRFLSGVFAVCLGRKEGNAHHIEREHQLARRISTAVTLLRAGRLKRLQKVV
jgi:hypothetical protein